MVSFEHVHFDTTACAHAAPAALLRVIGEHLFCGHCGADLPEFLHHTVVRCDGSVVRVTQADFGDLHVCGQNSIAESIDRLIDLTASVDNR